MKTYVYMRAGAFSKLNFIIKQSSKITELNLLCPVRGEAGRGEAEH